MNKKLEVKRLCIYLIFSFGLAWTAFLVFFLKGYRWDGTNPAMESFVGLGMLAPVISHVLTRWLTHEGFALNGKGSMMLGICLKDKKWYFYLLAVLLPWLYYELGYLVLLGMFPKSFDPEYYKVLNMDPDLIFILPVAVIINGVTISVFAFGEEGGWRGYMMPKLIELVGTKKAVFIGGILWGLWHAPLTCIGHNFGVDYAGFPYLGILFMCMDCTFMGIILTYVTVKSGSIWPAAIMHAVNNQNPSILYGFVNTEVVNQLSPHPLVGWLGLLLPVMLLGGLCLFLLLRDEKREKNL